MLTSAEEKDVVEIRVNIGVSFHHWRQLLVSKGMKFDAELTTFLLDW